MRWMTILAVVFCVTVATAGVHEGPDVIDPLGARPEHGDFPRTPVIWTYQVQPNGPAIVYENTETGEWLAIVRDGAIGRITKSPGWSWAAAGLNVAISPRRSACDPGSSWYDPGTSCASDDCSSDYWSCLDCANFKVVAQMEDVPDPDSQMTGVVAMTLISIQQAIIYNWSDEVGACMGKYQ